MNQKKTLDIAIIISCITGMILSYVYLENNTEKTVSLTTLGVIGCLFLILAVIDGAGIGRPKRYESSRSCHELQCGS